MTDGSHADAVKAFKWGTELQVFGIECRGLGFRASAGFIMFGRAAGL